MQEREQLLITWSSKKNFRHYSVRDFLVKEIEQRKLKVNRDSMTEVANELRARFGSAYITDCLYIKAVEIGLDCVIESIRTPGEIHSLRSKGPFVLLAVDATPEVRYQRILERKSATDAVSFETFFGQRSTRNAYIRSKSSESGCLH